MSDRAFGELGTRWLALVQEFPIQQRVQQGEVVGNGGAKYVLPSVLAKWQTCLELMEASDRCT